jgi:hypothetical protein
MTWLAALLKWCMENPKLLRYTALALGVILAAAWIYHRGESHEATISQAREFQTAAHVKEQYDEISNHRPDDRRLLDLLQHGAF